MSPAFEIKGWCPSAHRPMESGDGLLIRARSRQSALNSGQLRAVAEIAGTCGNGLVDLTQRAQLQLRGLSARTLDKARRRLQAHELYFPTQDSLVDILTSGSIGAKARGSFDVDALARTLAHLKESDPALRDLPPKFLISIDAEGGALADVQADIRIDAIDATRAAVCVAGAPERGVIVPAEDIAATTRKLMRAFAALRAERPSELRRMRRLVGALGLDALLREAGLEMRPYAWRTAIPARSALGVRNATGVISVGVAAPFGRWRAHELAALGAFSDTYGHGELAPTHWRLFIIPAQSGEAARRMADAARAFDLIVSPEDARLAVVACPGAPECSQARGETRAALARLAPLAQKTAGKDGVGLHVSGCAKGCARRDAAPVTLIANDGRFDLIEEGGANDEPVLRDLDINAVENALRARAKEAICPTP
ncbi:precorrin-3B synthase [Methylocystis sp. JAN1]|uniref:precorrin-3B synthase n=1 Tax=Methylocystis sp. JAN1 TaxID=3397211 RepID=UPI003FA21A09